MELGQKLIGCWRLVSFEMTTERGETLKPYGDAPSGRLIYLASGVMSAHLGAAARERLRGPRAGLPERTLTAFRSHFSYSGRYRVVGDEVLHDVDLSIAPDWVGETVVRDIDFDGEDLILTDRSARIGKDAGTGVLRWRRED